MKIDLSALHVVSVWARSRICQIVHIELFIDERKWMVNWWWYDIGGPLGLRYGGEVYLTVTRARDSCTSYRLENTDYMTPSPLARPGRRTKINHLSRVPSLRQLNYNSSEYFRLALIFSLRILQWLLLISVRLNIHITIILTKLLNLCFGKGLRKSIGDIFLRSTSMNYTRLIAYFNATSINRLLIYRSFILALPCLL